MSKIVQGNAQATIKTEFGEPWAIPIGGLSGLDLVNINSITVGVGDPDAVSAAGAEGTIFLDNIRLVAP